MNGEFDGNFLVGGAMVELDGGGDVVEVLVGFDLVPKGGVSAGESKLGDELWGATHEGDVGVVGFEMVLKGADNPSPEDGGLEFVGDDEGTEADFASVGVPPNTDAILVDVGVGFESLEGIDGVDDVVG